MQLAEDTRQHCGRNVKQRGIGEQAVKVCSRQIQPHEILLPDRAAGVGARHSGEAGCALQADGMVTQCCESLQIAPRSATEIENRKGWRACDMSQ